MQALCGLQGIFDLFNCKTPGGENSASKYNIIYLKLQNLFS